MGGASQHINGCVSCNDEQVAMQSKALFVVFFVVFVMLLHRPNAYTLLMYDLLAFDKSNILLLLFTSK